MSDRSRSTLPVNGVGVLDPGSGSVPLMSRMPRMSPSEQLVSLGSHSLVIVDETFETSTPPGALKFEALPETLNPSVPLVSWRFPERPEIVTLLAFHGPSWVALSDQLSVPA